MDTEFLNGVWTFGVGVVRWVVVCVVFYLISRILFNAVDKP